MGNENNDLGKYNCSCIQKEEGCFLDIFNDINSKDKFNLITNSKNLKKSELQENIPGGTHYPNDNMIKSSLRKKYNNNDIILEKSNEKKEKENDIKEFDKKTDYFQLVNKINEAIKELKSKLYLDDSKLNSNKLFDFKRLGNKANKIIFNDIISCIKKISDINSEVILIKEKIYLGIVNKFKKEKKEINLLNYEDIEKIIPLPNYDDIDIKLRLKLGDINNNKFKFYKFNIKGSFPNEILIWNLISQNTQKIADILSDNYYCCAILLYYSQDEKENETILYLINKPSKII